MIKLNIQRFGHTNSTTNYELPQFIGTDKPQWLTDINQAFLAIDTAVYNASSSATLANTSIGDLSDLTTTAKTNLVSAVNEVDSDLGTLSTTVANHTIAIGDNTTAIGTLANLSTTAKNDLVSAVNEVDNIATTNATHIGNLTNLDTTEKSNLVGAINEVNTLASEILKFNLGTSSTLNYTSTENISTVSQGTLSLSTNSDGSIFKLYGYLSGTATNTSGITFTFNSSLRPDNDYTISNCIVAMSGGYLTNAEIKVKTTGVIEVGCWANGSTHFEIVLPACIYFNKDLGDIPTP